MTVATEIAPPGFERALDGVCCRNCGDPITFINADRFGPCCGNLPTPWARGRNGRYNVRAAQRANNPAPAMLEEEEEEETFTPAACPNCESTEWTVTGQQRVDTRDEEEPDGEIVRYEPYEFDISAACAGCGNPMPHGIELESY